VWDLQLKFYLQNLEEILITKQRSNDDSLKLSIFNFTMNYGFEYLGNI
jgi:hypothetical protein